MKVEHKTIVGHDDNASKLCTKTVLGLKFFSKSLKVELTANSDSRGLVVGFCSYEIPIKQARTLISALTAFLLYLDPSAVEIPEDAEYFYW